MKVISLKRTPYLVFAAVVSAFGAQAVNSGEYDKKAENDRPAKQYWEDFKHDTNETWKSGKEAFRDGWVESKLETAFLMDKDLNPFKIDTDVDGYTAILKGTVASNTARQRASEVAKSVDGIEKVTNQLEVDPEAERVDRERRSFGRQLSDAAITAQVKAKLVADGDVSGSAIDVDTRDGEVTLSGEVDSSMERSLAEYIALSDEQVDTVHNKIKVKEKVSSR